MTQLLICDIDMTVADNTERMKRAEKAKSRYRAGLESMFSFELENPTNLAYVRKGIDDLLENLFWQVAFTPELVALDTLIEGVSEALYHLEDGAGYHVVFLTSRPESVRAATVAWLREHVASSLMSWDLVMKQPAFQFDKTVKWKVGMVQMLSQLFQADSLLVIDDSEDIRQAVLDAYPDGGNFGIVQVVESLAEAVKLMERSK